MDKNPCLACGNKNYGITYSYMGSGPLCSLECMDEIQKDYFYREKLIPVLFEVLDKKIKGLEGELIGN